MIPSDTEIIHPINAPIFNKKFKTVSLPITEGFGYNQVINIIQTYPVLLPRLGRYARLETTSDNVGDLYVELSKIDNSVLISRLHNYDEKNRFVTWGTLTNFGLNEDFYNLYLESLDLFLSSKRPIFLKKKETSNGFIIQSSWFYHLVNNDIYDSVEKATVSLSSVIVKFEKASLRSTHRFFLKRGVPPLMSVDANVGFFGENGLEFKPIRLAMTYDMLEFIKTEEEGSYSCYLYSVNNWKIGEREKPELNLVFHLRHLFYSPDSLFPFYGNFIHKDVISYELTLSKEIIKDSLTKLKQKTKYALKDFTRISPTYRSSQSDDGGMYFRILKPWVMFELVSAYALDPRSRDVITRIVSSDNIASEMDLLLEKLKSDSLSYNLIGTRLHDLLAKIANAESSRDI